MIKKSLISILVLLVIFSLSARFTIAKADDLVIQDDGKVILVITNNNEVLGETVTKDTSTKESAKPATQPQRPSPQAVPLVPPHTQSTVKINPPINNDKKMQITITTGTTQQPPKVTTNQTTKTPPPKTVTNPNSTAGMASPSPSPKQPTESPTNTITKSVDQVVAQGTNGQPVITIKSDQARQLTIQQGTTQVTTSLPLQIDTLTHALSVPSQNESARVSILPKEALQGIVDKGLLNAQSADKAKINLTKDTNGVDYNVQSERQGKLFGIFDVKSPVQVKLSAQNGKVVKTSQSLLFNILGGFIK